MTTTAIPDVAESGARPSRFRWVMIAFAFGATVTVKDTKGLTETYTVVGVDELDLEPDAVSWISPIGKALLAADMGDSIRLADGRTAKIVKIERRNDT